jgi:hypothetical protein
MSSGYVTVGFTGVGSDFSTQDFESDGAAIQAAINYAYENEIAEVRLSSGDFNTENFTIYLPSNITLSGSHLARTSLIGGTPYGDIIIAGFDGVVENSALKNIVLDVKFSEKASGFKVVNFKNFSVENVMIKNIGRDGWGAFFGVEDAGENLAVNEGLNLENLTIIDHINSSLESVVIFNTNDIIGNIHIENKTNGPGVGLWQKVDGANLNVTGKNITGDGSSLAYYSYSTRNITLNVSGENVNTIVRGANESDWGRFGFDRVENVRIIASGTGTGEGGGVQVGGIDGGVIELGSLEGFKNPLIVNGGNAVSHNFDSINIIIKNKVEVDNGVGLIECIASSMELDEYGNLVKETFYDYSDVEVYRYYCNTYNDTGVRLTYNVLFDDGGELLHIFKDGVISENKFVEFDGDIHISLYDDLGVRQSYNFIDVSNSDEIMEYRYTYDASGSNLSYLAIYDNGDVLRHSFHHGVLRKSEFVEIDGDVHISIYSSLGVRQSYAFVDLSGSEDIREYHYRYNSSGERISYSALYDNGDFLHHSFDSGVLRKNELIEFDGDVHISLYSESGTRQSYSFIDASNSEDVSEYHYKYNASGEQVSYLALYDKGDVLYHSFELGVLRRNEFVEHDGDTHISFYDADGFRESYAFYDISDSSDLREYTYRYNDIGEKLSHMAIYDSGDVLRERFVDDVIVEGEFVEINGDIHRTFYNSLGVREGYEFLDESDSEYYEKIIYIYDELGDVERYFLVFDNGDLDVRGGGGDDKLEGGNGNDTLVGGEGSDFILGGVGDDVIEGGEGSDVLVGGSGADVFIFRRKSEGAMGREKRTEIKDFASGEDLIDLSQIDALEGIYGDQSFNFIGVESHHGAGASLRYVNAHGNTFIYGDVDADGGGDFLIFLYGEHTLKASDFIM